MFTNVSRPSAVDVLRPFTVGDTFYASSTSELSKRAIGTTDQVYVVSGGVPVWSSAVVLSSLSVVDSGFSIIGSADATKKMMFEVDAQTAADVLTINTGAQTDSRTLSVPVLTANATLMVLSETQTVTGNKSFTGTVSVVDGSFSIVGSGDSTKTIKFEVDAQTAADDLTINSGAQTDDRTLSVPVLTANATLAVLEETQTFTGAKTFSAITNFTNTTAATSPSTGGVVLTGGLGIAKGFWAADRSRIAIAGDSAQFSIQRTGTSSGLIYWGATGDRDTTNTYDIATVYSTSLGNRIEFKIIDGSIPEITAAGSGSTGIRLANTTEATSVSAAATILLGGLGVAKRSYLGTIGSTFKGNVNAGVQDGTAAVAGQVGEVLSSTVSGVAVAGSGSVGNVTSVSLTPGDWLISGNVVIAGGATGLTSGSTAKMSIVATSATNGTSGDTMAQESVLALLANGLFEMCIPQVRVNISATTIYYMTEEVTYVAGSPTVAGRLTATRMR